MRLLFYSTSIARDVSTALCFAQHDITIAIPRVLIVISSCIYCHLERSREISNIALWVCSPVISSVMGFPQNNFLLGKGRNLKQLRVD